MSIACHDGEIIAHLKWKKNPESIMNKIYRFNKSKISLTTKSEEFDVLYFCGTKKILTVKIISK
jgi:hypothetical protein